MRGVRGARRLLSRGRVSMTPVGSGSSTTGLMKRTSSTADDSMMHYLPWLALGDDSRSAVRGGRAHLRMCIRSESAVGT